MTLLHKMREAGMTANVLSLSAANSAHEKGGQWDQALKLLHRKARHIHDCRWDQLQCSYFSLRERRAVVEAVTPFEKIRDTTMIASMISFTAAISACVKGAVKARLGTAPRYVRVQHDHQRDIGGDFRQHQQKTHTGFRI